jgi:hypothetical protein
VIRLSAHRLPLPSLTIGIGARVLAEAGSRVLGKTSGSARHRDQTNSNQVPLSDVASYASVGSLGSGPRLGAERQYDEE